MYIRACLSMLHKGKSLQENFADTGQELTERLEMAVFSFSNVILWQQNAIIQLIYCSQPLLLFFFFFCSCSLRTVFADHNYFACMSPCRQKWLHEAEVQCHLCSQDRGGKEATGKIAPLQHPHFIFLNTYTLQHFFSFDCIVIRLKILPGVNAVNLIYSGEEPGGNRKVSRSKEQGENRNSSWGITYFRKTET